MTACSYDRPVTTTTAAKPRDPKPTPERVIQLAGRVLDGDIILPEFQRPFVWKRRQILDLLDSIYRNFPIGSLLVWESKQKLASKRSIADLEVAERSEAYPVNYLLDGQQRLSTICGVLYWEPGDAKSVWNVLFDLKTQRFAHADTVDELPVHQIPLRRLSSPADYYRKLTPLDDQALRDRADLLFNRFTDYQVPLVTLGDMSIEDVAPVFERINSTGTRLTIYDLMRAATWSPEFDLGKTVDGIKAALAPRQFDELDNKTFLRVLGAAAGGDFSAQSMDALRDLPLDALSAAADAVKESALRAADFLRTEISAPRAEALPYANQFAVLCELFRLIPTPNTVQLAKIKGWFWRTTLSGYFGGWNSGQMGDDARSLRTFAAGDPSSLDARGVLPTAGVWKAKPFRANSAVSKMLALMIAADSPLDLITGQKIDIGKSLAWSNDKEFHHFFPQQHLARAGRKSAQINVVANIVLLTSKSNIAILDRAPSEYLASIIDEVGRPEVERRLLTNLVPSGALDAALVDDYDVFLEARAAHIHARALLLSGSDGAEGASFEVDDLDVDPAE